MSGRKIPKDTDEMQEDSSDNESVLEKPKKTTVAKEKKPYVMTENVDWTVKRCGKRAM